MRFFASALALLFSFAFVPAAEPKAPATDIVFRNATIYDGSGEKPTKGDVHIKGDKIAAVGKVGKIEGATEVEGRRPGDLPRLHRPAHPLRLRAER